MEKESLPNLRISYEALVNIALAKVKLMKRDIGLFNKFEIKLKDIVKFESEINAFTMIPADEDMTFGLAQHTNEKKQKAAHLRTAIAMMHLHLKNFYHTNQNDFEKVKISNLSGLRDDRLLVAADLLFKYIKTHVLKYYKPKSFLVEFEMFEKYRSEFSDVLAQHKIASQRRNKNTMTRRKKAIDIYNKLSNWCDIGRNGWKLELRKDLAAEYSLYLSKSESDAPAPKANQTAINSGKKEKSKS